MTMTAPEPQAPNPITRPRSWRIAYTPGTFLLNANQRLPLHTRTEHTKALRQTAWALARAAKIPPMQRAHISYVLHPNTRNQRRDPGNWAPTAKAAIDGLVDARVLPDDDHTRLLGPDPRIGPPVKGSQFVLWITDLDQMHPHHIALLNPPASPENGALT